MPHLWMCRADSRRLMRLRAPQGPLHADRAIGERSDSDDPAGRFKSSAWVSRGIGSGLRRPSCMPRASASGQARRCIPEEFREFVSGALGSLASSARGMRDTADGMAHAVELRQHGHCCRRRGDFAQRCDRGGGHRKRGEGERGISCRWLPL